MIQLIILLGLLLPIISILFRSTYLLEEARAKIRASLLDSIETCEFLINKVIELEQSKRIVLQKIAVLKWCGFFNPIWS